MLQALSDASGIIVASAILFAARELRRIGNAVRDLDYRVSNLERWLHRSGVPERPGRPTDHPGPIEIRSRSGKGGSPGSGRDSGSTGRRDS